jgi:hypothetical protein
MGTPFDPPWRFDPLKIPKRVYWGGAYILLQFAANGGGSASRDIHAKIDFPVPAPRYDDNGKPIAFVPSEIVYARDQLLVDGSDNHFYEGIFLIKVGTMPFPDPNTGVTPTYMTVALSGASDPDDNPGNVICATSTLHITYFNHYDTVNYGGQFDVFVCYERRTTTITDPNGTRTEVAENWIKNLSDDEFGIGRAVADDFAANPQSPQAASDTSQWYFSTTLGKYVDTRQPCGPYVPVPFDVRFTASTWLFPGGMVVFPSDKYFPLRLRGPVPEGSPPGTKGPLLDWFDAFTFEFDNDDVSNHDLPTGLYHYKLERRKFREFTIPGDEIDDLPPLKEPFTEAEQAAHDAENQKRRDEKKKMLQIYPTDFTYTITLFRYPRQRTAPTIPPTPPPPIPTSYDIEWDGPLSGAPPTLKTFDPDA